MKSLYSDGGFLDLLDFINNDAYSGSAFSQFKSIAIEPALVPTTPPPPSPCKRSPVPPKKRKRPVRSQSHKEDVRKSDTKKKRSNAASVRFRQKRRDQRIELAANETMLRRLNGDLHALVELQQKELVHLKALLSQLV